MNSESPVALTKTTYRGVTAYELKWVEGAVDKESSFPTEAEAVMAMSEIEERLRIAAMAGQGLTVNPFGLHTPFISSKDVHFASLKLQPRGLKFRESIEDYVSAVTTLKGLDVSVSAAAAVFAEASLALKPYDISTEQAVFEWLELKKQVGDRPIYEVLRTYLQAKAAAEMHVPIVAPPEAGGAGDRAVVPAT
ncbi:hypothetical protein RAHE111665_07690 [Rariglobus hedericola]